MLEILETISVYTNEEAVKPRLKKLYIVFGNK